MTEKEEEENEIDFCSCEGLKEKSLFKRLNQIKIFIKAYKRKQREQAMIKQ